MQYRIRGSRNTGFELQIGASIFGIQKWRTIAKAASLREIVAAGHKYSKEELQKSVDKWAME